MARQRLRPPARLTTAHIRFWSVLLSAVVLGGVLGRPLSTRLGLLSGGDAPGMTAVVPPALPSRTTLRTAPEPARVPSPAALDTSVARVERSTEVAARERALASMEGTYMPEVIAEGGSRVKRWAERMDDPIRVWIASGDSVPGFRPSFATAVREAFVSWEQSGVPVRFVFVDSADSAEVRIDWTDRLPERRAGTAQWWKDSQGWLTKASIVLAMQLSDDGPANDTSMHRMALHEIGHLLGLEHSLDAGDIMASWVNANELSARDRATVRLLYTLQPGDVSEDAGAPGS